MSDKFGALKAAALAATQGPWIKTEDDWRDSEDALITCDSRKGMTAIAKIDGGGEESGYSEPFKSEQQANAAFIAAANPAVVLDLLAALEVEREQRIAAEQRIAELDQGQQKPAGYIDARCFEGPYPTGGSWSLNPYNGAGLNQITPFYLAPPKQTPLGYVDMFAVMRMHEGRMSFCALRPEPRGISYVSVYAGDSVAVPKEQKA